MASKTIHTLNYKIVADTSKFKNEMVATKKEVAAAKRTIASTATPLDKYKKQTSLLSVQLKKGLINQKQYNQALKNSKSKYDTARRAAGKLTKAEKSLALAKKATMGLMGVGAAAVFTVGRGIAKQMEDVDKLSKFAKQVDFPIEQLTRFQLVAEKTSGVGADAFNTSIQKMVLNTSEAATGLGMAKDSIKELGLSADALSKKKPDQQFLDIASALKKVENQSDRNRLAYKIFGRQGAALVTTLELGADAITRQGKEADALGLTISQMDASKIEAANDALTDAAAMWKGLMRTLAVEILPTLTEVIDGLRIAMGGEVRTVSGAKVGEERVAEAEKIGRQSQAHKEWLRTAKDTSQLASKWEAIRIGKRTDEFKQWLKNQQAAAQVEIDKADALKNEAEQRKKAGEAFKIYAKVGQDFGANFMKNLERDNWIKNTLAAAKPSDKLTPLTAPSANTSDSLAAGSSAAFKFLNRTEGEVQTQQLKIQQEMLAELRKNNTTPAPEPATSAPDDLFGGDVV